MKRFIHSDVLIFVSKERKYRHLSFLLFLILSSQLILTASANNISVQTPSFLLNEPKATFEKMWVDYDTTMDGQRGMLLHVKFTAYDMLNMDAALAVYFEFVNNKTGWLKDKNQKFYSSDGFVAVYKNIKPLYNPALFNDLSVFMPYAELDLDPGSYEISMDVKLIRKEGGLIQRLTRYKFQYTKPGSESGVPVNAPSATVEKVWVDYGVTENGKSGMRIHVKFTVLNMKDIEGSLAIYFETKDGELLKSDNINYKSKSGQLALYKTLKPGYVETVYNDMQLFIPYSEIIIGPGKHDLSLDVDVIYKNGDLVKHLKYHDFWIQK